MFLLEHDAKTLLALSGLPVPHGVLLAENRLDAAELPPPPWIVKAQLPVGGRGKAGLIRPAATSAELRNELDRLFGRVHRGYPVRECRVEAAVDGAEEAYLSIALDPASGTVRVLVSGRGGVDIETLAGTPGAVHDLAVPDDAEAIAAAVRGATAGLAPHLAHALADAGARLGQLFVEGELRLAEINPLFVSPDGSWTAGDAKIVVDENALPHQHAQLALLESRAAAYPAAHRKHVYGCDYVVVDPDGEIGLLTTGAGLSMMLIDELGAAGLRPYNFLDVRTGGLKGDPTRLVHVLEWIAEGPRVKVLLVNIFAGITDLGEFSRLLLAALDRTATRLPVVARLVGTNVEAARETLAARGIAVEPDLARALARVREYLNCKP